MGTAGGLMEAGATPRGPDTPEQAVEAFIASMDLTQQDYVVDLPDAWVLRSDGTAVARMDFLHGDGWMVYGYSLCA